MTPGISGLRAALRGWPDQPFSAGEGVVGRLASALEEQRTSSDPRVGPDIQVLVRQVFYREWMRGGEQSVEVPVGRGWPEPVRWLGHGFEFRNANNGACWLDVQPWMPDWLENGIEDPFAGTIREESRRHYKATPTDPFVRDVTEYEMYTSYAQRDAVRGFMMARPGSVVVVTLPTGSGKSLLAHLPVLLGPPEGHFTIVIVPTVALAIDQEAQFRELASSRNDLIDRRLAWYSELSGAEKKTILNDMEGGQQRILFASPEAVCGSLRNSLEELCSRGFLANFVVDEVHLLAQWGDEFRPAYQQLVGVWRSLRAATPNEARFKTLLMTATLTEGVMDTLDALFDHGRPLQAIAAVGLRSEPEYWFARAVSEQQRQDWLLDAFARAPRPLILYVTTVEDCKNWYDRFRARGFQRIAAFHGQTPGSERERTIADWRLDKLDVVVATSAFGVGIDKGNVRTVIHACVPETIDRFYQEVGRGGRDGLASTSLVVWTDADLHTARKLARQKTIKSKKGLARWEAMLATRHDHDSFIEIDLEAVPEHLHVQNESSRLWNLRTIILMARARFLELGPPVRDAARVSDGVSPAPNRTGRSPMLVRILEPDHRVREIWESKLEQYRKANQDYCMELFSCMNSILRGSSEVSEVLARAYRLKRSWFSYVSRECAGCPECRKLARDGVTSQLYATHSVEFTPPDLATWEDRFAGRSPILHYVVIDPHRICGDQKSLAELIALAMSALNIRELGFGGDWSMVECDLAQMAYNRANKMPFAVNWQSTASTTYCDYSKIGRITCLQDLGNRPVPCAIIDEQRALHLVFVPHEARDPIRNDRRLIDVNTNWIWAEDFRGALTRWES